MRFGPTRQSCFHRSEMELLRQRVAASGRMVQNKVVAARFMTAFARTYMVRTSPKVSTDEDWSGAEIDILKFNDDDCEAVFEELARRVRKRGRCSWQQGRT